MEKEKDPRQKMLERCVYEIDIRSKDINIQAKGLNYQAAWGLVTGLVEGHPDDEQLQEAWNGGKNAFGFYGRSHGNFSYHVSAQLARIKTEEKVRCGRRGDMFSRGALEKDPLPDHWDVIGDDRVCSYCGSLHPDDFLNLIKTYGFKIVGGTDKGYKFYIENHVVPERAGIINAGMGAIKFYAQHFGPEHIEQYNDLLTKHRQAKVASSNS